MRWRSRAAYGLKATSVLGGWRSKLKHCAPVPLSKLQSDILRLLAAHRDPESYVAGSAWLTRDGSRFSADIDIFHDREERVARAGQEDVAVLEATGLTAEWRRREPAFYQAVVSRDGESTRLEWVVDSDFRFFPTQVDEVFGYVLHPVDLATNKAMAAAGRREPRDIVDLVAIHRDILPLGAVIWAAVEKALGFTPEGLINEIRRLAHYTASDFARVDSDPPVDPVAIMKQLKSALDDAESFVTRMPTDKIGLLFLKDGKPVQPDPVHLDDYVTHAGARRGHWPSSPEIGSAMLERYGKR
jgi:hypothetical protein